MTEARYLSGSILLAMPGMGDALQAVLERPVLIAPQPQLTCALGAALLAAERCTERPT